MWLLAGQFLHQTRGHMGMNHCLSISRFAYRVGQFCQWDIFEEVGECASADSRKDVFILVIRGKHDDLCARAFLLNAARGLHAIHAWHDEIHQDHIGSQVCDQQDGFAAGTDCANYLEIVFQLKECTSAMTYNRMIVYDQDGNGIAHHCSSLLVPTHPCTTGRHTSTSVPLASLLIRSVPCTRSARSRMLERPSR